MSDYSDEDVFMALAIEEEMALKQASLSSAKPHSRSRTPRLRHTRGSISLSSSEKGDLPNLSNMHKDPPSPSGHLILRSNRGKAAQAAQAARAALRKSSASTTNALGSAQSQTQPKAPNSSSGVSSDSSRSMLDHSLEDFRTEFSDSQKSILRHRVQTLSALVSDESLTQPSTANNSSSVLSDSQNSVIRHSIDETLSDADAPDWKQRLTRGQDLTSDGFDLFSPSKLEGVFKQRTPPRVHFEDELKQVGEEPQKPSTFATEHRSSQQSNSFRSSRHLVNDLEVVHEEDEDSISLSSVRGRPLEPNMSSVSPSSSIGPMKASTLNDPRWRTISGQQEMKNEIISPINTVNTANEDKIFFKSVVFRTLDEIKKDVEQLEANIGMVAFGTPLRPSSSSSDKEINYGHTPATEHRIDMTISSLPDDLSMGTEGFSTYKAIQNHKKNLLDASDISGAMALDSSIQDVPSTSPLKLFGNHDTYTNNKLNRILEMFAEAPDSSFDDLGAKLAAKADNADAAINGNDVPQSASNIPSFLHPEVKIYRDPEPRVVSAAMAAVLKDSTDAIGFKTKRAPEQSTPAPEIDRTNTKRLKTLRDGHIAVQNQNVEVEMAYDSDSSIEPFERPPSREGPRRAPRRNPNIVKHTPEVASFLNKFREPSGSDFRDVVPDAAPKEEAPLRAAPPKVSVQEVTDINDMSVVPAMSKPTMAATPAPKASVSILSLTPLSDFTVHQTDSGKNQSFVQERHHPSALRQAHGSTALTNDAVVKAITNALGDTLYWDKIRKITIAPGKLASIHKLKEYLPRVTEVSLPDNMVEHVEGLPACVRTLDIKNNMLNQLTSWSHLANLQYLDVSGNRLENLDGFCSLVHLRSLIANNNQITNITGIFKLRGLLHLEIRYNKISALNFSDAKLRRLRTLDLSHNELKEVQNLHKLQDLQEVDISHNALEKWLPEKSAQLCGLRKLTASNNMLTSINLKTMPMVKILDLDFNSINEIPDLPDAYYLELLSLRNQADAPNIVNFVLSSPNECRQIRLSSNSVVDGSFALPCLPHHNLRALELAACGISDLPDKFGSFFPNCRQINLNYNAIKELIPLRGMHKLTHIFAAQNRLSKLRRTCVLLSKLPALREIDIRENPCTLGFYSPASLDGNSQPAREDATYRLPPGSPKTDPSWVRRLDETTIMRRRLLELLMTDNCHNLVQLDGLQFRRSELKKKSDKVFTKLTERGVLAVPCFS